ncbi:MAG: RagB/SusD family nutrient uptake outer membrane protein [Rikenellaceae bacterium]|nr:RagB/SusD family nutrient uptake outer membrane protein [Rikenellaceae bacterium]
MKKIVLITAAVVLDSSCKSFLEEDSQTLSYVTEAEELRELIQGSCYLPTRGVDVGRHHWIDVMDDNSQEAYASNNTSTYTADYTAGQHHWTTYPYYEVTSLSYSSYQGGNALWGDFYELIFACNIVLDEIERFKEEEPEAYRAVKGEASALRGIYYFYLTNLFGPPYEAATAGSDLGVPLKTAPYIEKGGFARATVKACYDRIVQDLETAVDLLEGVVQKTTLRCNQNAARIYLSRAYLFMGEWQKAWELADRVLSDPGDAALYDFNQGVPSSSVAFTNAHTFQETVFINGCGYNGMSGANGRIYEASPDLIGCYTP